MATRYYYRENVTVHSFDGFTGLLQELGDGRLRIEADEVENTALMDEWKNALSTVKSAEFTGELAASDESGAWFAKVGVIGTYTLTDTDGTVTGDFECISAEKVMGDALRWNITMRSRGTVSF